jgi:hypothetical protein
MPVFLDAAGTITKEFLEAASSYMNWFLKAAGTCSPPFFSFQQYLETCS